MSLRVPSLRLIVHVGLSYLFGASLASIQRCARKQQTRKITLPPYSHILMQRARQYSVVRAAQFKVVVAIAVQRAWSLSMGAQALYAL